MSLGLPDSSLDREHSAEHHDAADQADNVVEKGCDRAELDGSLGPLHEGGISQKHSKPSICCIYRERVFFFFCFFFYQTSNYV